MCCECWDNLEDGQKRCAYICFGILLLIGVILFAVSWSTLSPVERGLDFNNALVQVDETKVWKDGRHFLGLGHRFIKYPITWQTITFGPNGDKSALAASTNVGDSISLEITVFYKFNETEIPKLYRKHGETGYKTKYENIIAESVKNVASENEYGFDDYYLKRKEIQLAMERRISLALAKEFAIVRERGVLMGVDFPTNVNDKIIKKMIAAERINTESQSQQVEVVRAAIEVEYAFARAEKSILLTDANSVAKIVTEEANAAAIEVELAAQQEAFEILADGLAFTPNELMNYIWLGILREAGDADNQMLVGFGNSILHFSS